MYSHCIFCLRSLGANQRVEHFPVGRQLAFDSSRGRLWVICPSCGRWNLTPLEERWEAIEECERLHRATRLRASTGQVGLARLPDGLQLVRIGQPERPELAAWRYGRRFLERWKRNTTIAIGVNVAAAAYLGLQVAGLISTSIFFQGARVLLDVREQRRLIRRLGAAESPSGERTDLRRRDLSSLRLVETGAGGWGLELHQITYGPWEDRGGGIRVRRPTSAILEGEVARDVLAKAMVAVNAAGASEGKLERTMELLDQIRGSEEDVLRRISRGATTPGALIAPTGAVQPGPVPLDSLDDGVALALEMLLHEEEERKALSGELRLLESRWKEAEALAAIADPLGSPASVEAALQRLRTLVRPRKVEHRGAADPGLHGSDPGSVAED